jgi:hypothetical protein
VRQPLYPLIGGLLRDLPCGAGASSGGRIEFIYTPVHGSWLNMMEIEISVLVRQCLRRRLPDIETLRLEASAWSEERNRLGASVDWRFTTEDARVKLCKLYPSIEH